jgi:hypothetical protein
MAMKMYLPPPGQSRRGFLKKGLFGGAVLALGGAGFFATRPTRLVGMPQEGLLTFDEKEYAVVHAIAARMVPARPGFPTIDEVRVAFNADRVLQRADAGARGEVKQLIGLFENGLANLIFGGRTKPFTQLDGVEQDEVLREWQDSRLEIRRTGLQALRALVLASYYGSPLTWKAVSYGGPPEGFWQKDAPVWKGKGQVREGNGVWVETAPEAPAPSPEVKP